MGPGAPAAAAAILLLLLPAGAVQPPLPAPWVVAGDVTVEGTPLLLTADVVVASGGALRLRGVDAWLAGAPGREVRIVVEPGGVLTLEDGRSGVDGRVQPTRLRGLPGPYRVVVEPGGTLLAANLTAEAGRFDFAGEVRMQGSQVRLDQGAMRVRGGSTLIAGGALEGSPDHLVEVEGGALVIEDAALRDATGAGVRVLDGARATLRRVALDGLGAYAVEAVRAELVVEDSALASGDGYALRAEGAWVTLRGTRFEGHCGAFLVDGTRGVVAGNVFDVAGRAVTLTDPGPIRVADNTFHGPDEGVHADGGSPEVRGNRFASGDRGVVLAGSAAVVEDNVFLSLGGIDVVAGGAAALPVLRGNAFSAASAFGLRNGMEEPVDARGNWWGSASGPAPPGQGAAVEGAADVEPWLAAPPGP